ncbi:MAG: HyaD/HybD family hydrogenase maturation endopeptidase [Dehalococcoidia bacterium]|nr:HyaD/HybD family hydrogenase maturation endopeptidase [Dehalococcoidia bacterium]
MVSSECHRKRPKIAVIGVGNLLLRDEGIGVHVVQALQGMDLENSGDVQVIDAGTSPDVVLSLEGVDKLIIIDAAEGHCEPGTVYCFRPEELPQESAGIQSLHEVSFTQSLRILDNLGLKPKDIVIFGVQPKEIDWGLEPSVELTERIPEIVRLVLEETRKC